MEPILSCFFVKKKKNIYLKYKQYVNSFFFPHQLYFFQKSLFGYKISKLQRMLYFRVKKAVFFPTKIMIKLNGLNFKIIVIKNYLQLVLGYSHVVYIKLPFGVKFEWLDEKKNIFFLESFNRNLLFSFILLLKTLKPVNCYTQTGFTLLKEIIKIKIGKKK